MATYLVEVVATTNHSLRGVIRLADDVRIEAADLHKRRDGTVHGTVTLTKVSHVLFVSSVNLTSDTSRRKFLNQVIARKSVLAAGITIDDGALMALEQFGRQQRETGTSHNPLSPNPLEDSKASPQVITSPEVDLILGDSKGVERVIEALHQCGWVGDYRPPLLAYIAMTTRLLDRPMNLAFVAQSATGKSTAVDMARALMPPEACYLMRAGSERALIYCNEEFTRRMVIVGEADSIPDDGAAASAIRSLASDNVLAYDVVEPDPTTKQFTVRRIEKPGPTGLITTSTKSLQHQLGTRVLEVPLRDDAEQTRQIMAAQARTAAGTTTTFNPDVWIAVQRSLAMRSRLGSLCPSRTCWLIGCRPKPSGCDETFLNSWPASKGWRCSSNDNVRVQPLAKLSPPSTITRSLETCWRPSSTRWLRKGARRPFARPLKPCRWASTRL
jgi:hypothetical protein